jgi:hypothetical protein
MTIGQRIRNWFLSLGSRFVQRSVPALPAAPSRADSYRPRRQAPLPTRVEWFLADIQNAMRQADAGQMRDAALLVEAFRLDGRIVGLMNTRTFGLLALPRELSSDAGATELLAALKSRYDYLVPIGEAAAMLSDLAYLGFAIGELVDGGHAGIRLARLLSEGVTLNVSTGEIRYNGEPVIPGNGRWVWFERSDVATWRQGIWPALARPFIAKDHAIYLRENYSNKLANAARVAKVPLGASDVDAQSWFESVASWGPDTTFATRPGYEVDLVEGNGVGYDVFRKTIEDSDNDSTFAIAGQKVTSEGTPGFTNGNMFATIAGFQIEVDASVFVNGINSQVLPWWQDRAAVSPAERAECLSIKYDTESPEAKKNRLQSAVEVWTKAAEAVTAINQVLSDSKQQVDVVELVKRLSIPVTPIKLDGATAEGGGQIFAYHLDAGVVTKNEVRKSLNFPPLIGFDVPTGPPEVATNQG